MRSTDTVLRARAVLDVLRSGPNRGFDVASIAAAADASEAQVRAAAGRLVRSGEAVRFVGGLVPQRVHYQLAARLCEWPHTRADDAPKCGAANTSWWSSPSGTWGRWVCAHHTGRARSRGWVRG